MTAIIDFQVRIPHHGTYSASSELHNSQRPCDNQYRRNMVANCRLVSSFG